MSIMISIESKRHSNYIVMLFPALEQEVGYAVKTSPEKYHVVSIKISQYYLVEKISRKKPMATGINILALIKSRKNVQAGFANSILSANMPTALKYS
jgi:hypothetical protein